MTDIESIIKTRERLDKELQLALSTMERKDTISKIRLEMIKNQSRCPHFDNNYNWDIIDGECPYCGYHLSE